MAHLNDVKKSEQRRVKKNNNKQTNRQATQRERAPTSILEFREFVRISVEYFYNLLGLILNLNSNCSFISALKFLCRSRIVESCLL